MQTSEIFVFSLWKM